MNPIQILVKWRFHCLLKKLGIDWPNLPKNIWPELGKKLVIHNYISDEESVAYYGYWIIKNIIWKGIINYDFIFGIKEVHVNMLYINYHEECSISTRFLELQPAHPSNKNFKKSIKNMHSMWNTIINYFMLISIISEDLILDVRNEIKNWLYHVIFQMG